MGVSGRDEDSRIRYRYDGDGHLYLEQRGGADDRSDRDDRDDGRILRYTLDQSGSLSQILTASSGRESATFLYGHAAERLAGFSGRESAYYATDARSSVRGTTDARGRPTSARSYDAWGTPVRGSVFDIDSDERGERESDGDSGRSSLTQLFGFDGERQDPRTGLVNLRARWYQPGTGRMLGRDPFAGYATQPLTQHPYVFGQDNPWRYADPSGRSARNLLKALDGVRPTAFYSGPRTVRIPTGLMGNTSVEVAGAASSAPRPLADNCIDQGWVQSDYQMVAASVGCTQALEIPGTLPDPVDGLVQCPTPSVLAVPEANAVPITSQSCPPFKGPPAPPPPDTKPDVQTDTKTKRSKDRPIPCCPIPPADLDPCDIMLCIYRNGSQTTDALTPRPGTGDVDPLNNARGLSFFDSVDRLPTGKWFAITPFRLVSLQAINDDPTTGHWSVRPEAQPELEAWAATRGSGVEHPYTTEVRSAKVKEGVKK